MQWQRAELAERLSKVLEEKLHQKAAPNMEQEWDEVQKFIQENRFKIATNEAIVKKFFDVGAS